MKASTIRGLIKGAVSWFKQMLQLRARSSRWRPDCSSGAQTSSMLGYTEVAVSAALVVGVASLEAAADVVTG